MKLLISLIFLTVTAAPANAVDYLQCREMLRTKNEMVDKAARAEIRFKDSMVSSPYEQCPDSMFQTKGKYFSRTNYDAQRACETRVKLENKNEIERTARVLGTDYQGAKLYSPEGLKWGQAYGKVASDMKKAGCPYS